MAEDEENFEEEEEDEENRKKLVDPETLPDGSKTVFVGAWSQTQTIADGLALCNEGDTLYCNGTEYDEQINLNKDGVSLVGPADMSCVVKKGVLSSSLFSSISKMSIMNGVEVKCGNVNISECDLSNAEKAIRVHQLANPTVSGCTIHDISKIHVYIYPGGNGVFEKNVLTGTGERDTVAVFLDNAGSTVIRNNTISNTMIGVYTCNGCQGIVVEDNVIADSTATAIHVDKQSKPTVRSNEILQAGHYGVLVSGESGGIFSKNIIHSSVRINEGCRPSFYDNMVVIPAQVVNDAPAFAISGLPLKKPEELPKKKKPEEAPPPEDEE